MKNDSKELQFIGDYPYPKEMTSGKLKGHVQAYYDPKSDMVVIRLRKFAESPEEKETVEEVTAWIETYMLSEAARAEILAEAGKLCRKTLDGELRQANHKK